MFNILLGNDRDQEDVVSNFKSYILVFKNKTMFYNSNERKDATGRKLAQECRAGSRIGESN